MRGSARILALVLVALSLSVATAEAAREGSPPAPGVAVPVGPPDEDFRQMVMEERERMKVEYEEMCADRLARLKRRADSALGVVRRERARRADVAARARSRKEARKEGSSFSVWLLIFGVHLLFLLLRFRVWRPAARLFGRFRRRSGRDTGPVTLQLRPRADRYA